jgi:transposase
MDGLDLTHPEGYGEGCEVKPIKRNEAAPMSWKVDRQKPASRLSGSQTSDEAMLNPDQHMDIKLLSRQGHSIRAIARMTGYSRNTVRKVLAAKGAPVFKPGKRASKLDPYKDYLQKRIQECNLSGVRLLEEIRGMGYAGGATVLKDYLRQIRPRRSPKLVVRYETPPGEQSQCDWGHCGRYRDSTGRLTSVYAFILILGYSRFMFVTFTTRMHLKTLIGCHQKAFDYCGGWTRSILYDNMKQVRTGPRELNPAFVDFADHYGFVARTHRPYRPQTKGKVERMVYYVKDNFLNGRAFADLDDLNVQARVWLEQTANGRIHQTTGQRPRDLLKGEKLIPSGSIPHYHWVEREPRVVTSEARVLYQRCHYSVPAIAVGQNVFVEDHGQRIAIRMGDTIIAEHPRAERPGQSVVLEEHTREHWNLVMAEAAQRRIASPTWSIGSAPAVQSRSLSVYEEVAR